MKRKIFGILGVVVLLSSFLIAAAPVAADRPPPVIPPTTFPRNRMAPPGPDPMDLSPEMLGEKEIAIRELAAQVGSAAATDASPIGEPVVIGEEFTFTISDDGLGIDYDETFVVLLDGTHGIILITKDAYESFDGTYYHFENPYGVPGAPEDEPWKRMEDLISHAQLEYILGQFDTVIYPTVADIYGEPLPRGDEGTKAWLLILNIRDDAYYDPEETTYIAGYFSAGESAAYNKNIIHIDSYAWADRTGPGVSRPYLYEGIVAHEFEHLVHFDIDPDEPSWVDEGMADIAGYFCGYGHFSGHIANYLVFHPFTSLTFWGSGLEDYGASYLFILYLYEKFGGAPFISAVVQEQANGIEGIELTLEAFGYPDAFDDIFDDWTIANYLDDTRVNDRYGYNTLDIGTIDSWGYSIEYALQNFWGIDPFEVPVGFYSSEFLGTPQPYTAHYYRFGGQPTLRTALDGDDTAGTTAHSGTYEWYSDAEAWAWRSFYQTFTLPMTDTITLNFWTFYEIEEDWDYGYVEVHDVISDTWTTLPGLGTVNTLPHPQDNPNTPDGREPEEYCQPDPANPPACLSARWNALTGYSGGWYQESMDLTPFAGRTIDLYFTTWQDGAFTLQMMYVDDIEIPQIGFFDDVESGEDGWTSTGWYITDGIWDNNWEATLIETLWQPTARYPRPERWHARKLLSEIHMMVDDTTESGEITGIRTTPVESRRTQVLIVSNRSDHIITADYWVEFTDGGPPSGHSAEAEAAARRSR